MNTNTNKRITKAWAILLRILGLAGIVFAAILNRDRTGDWFFRSETFSDKYASALLALRVILIAIGILLLVFSAKLVNHLQTWWSRLTEFQRIYVQILLLTLFGMLIYTLSAYFRENLLPLGQVARHRTKYKMLGFDVVIQDNPLMTSDFFTCIFLGMAAVLSYGIHFLHRFNIVAEQNDRRSSPGILWVILALGFFFAALDEYFGIHEFIGDNIIKHRDDIVMMVYAVLAVAILAKYIRYLASFRQGFYMFVLGAFLQSLAVVSDRFAISAFLEEGLEELAAIFYLGGAALYLVREVLFYRSSAGSHVHSRSSAP